MAFHEVRLPGRLAFGSTGGVERRTDVVTLASGFERRSSPWSMGRRRYLIGANLRSLADMAELTAFFEARRGRLYGFRFRDFADFASCGPGATPTAEDQALGFGDGTRTTFQLAKAYSDPGSGPEQVVRPISKPVDGSVRVSVGGAELASDGFATDTVTGVVTLSSPPASGVAVSAGFLFDTPVRFDADRLEVTLESFGAGRMAAVPLVELRL